ncbi:MULTISPECIES: hypothetical protein [unclassified Pseudoalteromonas]|uniref:hypothetical protein n=1 Tax=unclassified Pseudoalteromonas TaxID=194690 RepID=UPI00110A2E66|nr:MULTISPECIES: hypothetical protein [unclassified Pseudoalteromonas]TMP43211.1 hypothetical protein CWB80_16890 [Pseudoalteromonas sp. S1650]TMP65336.1 hypothetical protein CWB79_16715 [Pseudoalteromonas sp. S1649]
MKTQIGPMSSFKFLLIVFAGSIIGAISFYTLQEINSAPSTRTTTSEERRVIVWLDQFECGDNGNCGSCKQAITERKKLEHLKSECPSSALQWKYE